MPMNLANAVIPTNQASVGVVKTWPGQDECYSGFASCSVFREQLINSLQPRQYSKIAMNATVLDVGLATERLQFDPQAWIAFDYVQGDPGGTNGFPAWYLATHGETSLQTSEDPVPQNDQILFCAVGMTCEIERPWADVNQASAKSYPNWLVVSGDYRETSREDLYDNVWMSLNVGNNKCAFDLGLARHYPSPNAPNGSDILAPGYIAMPLVFTPFNAVVCMGSLKNNRRVTMQVSLDHGFSIPQTSLQLPATGSAKVYVPVAFEWFGFFLDVIRGQQIAMSVAAQQIPG